MSNLHPIFEAALEAFGKPATAREIALSAYIKALNNHDWSFEYSDDHSVWKRGWESIQQLRLAQRELDPDFVIWNGIAPEAHRVQRSPEPQ